MDNPNIPLGISNITVGVLIIVLCLPLLKGRIGMNHWYGMRFRKSFQSKENWYRINGYGAQRMILWSAVLVIVGVLTLFIPVSSKGILSLVISSAPLIIIIPAIETWLYTRKL